MLVNILIKTEFGEYKSQSLDIEESDYDNLVEISKGYYKNGFDLATETGHVIIPPDIIKRSVMIIEIIKGVDYDI